MSQFIQNFKYFPLFILFTFSSFFTLFAQASDKYWVYFTDKGDHSIVNFNAQELFTEAALERRQRQGVALDFHDLPVYPDYVNDLASRGVSIGVESRWLNAVSITVYDDLTPGAIAVLPYVKKNRTRAQLAATPGGDEGTPIRPEDGRNRHTCLRCGLGAGRNDWP